MGVELSAILINRKIQNDHIAICSFIKNDISQTSNRARDLSLVSKHMFLIPRNHLELFIYSFMVLRWAKIQHHCQICEIFTFWFLFEVSYDYQAHQ